MGPRMAGPEINHRSAGPSAGGAPAGPPDSAASALSKAADGAWRNLIEFAGEVRTLRSFPWFTWAKHDHDVDFDEPGIHLTQVTPTSCSWAHSVLASQSATIERYGVGSTAMACCTRR